MAFSQTSRNIRLSGASTLQAQCEKNDGSWVDSSLDLDTGIGNNQGRFDTTKTMFSDSAVNVTLSGTTLSARLEQSGGALVPASIDLDPIIANMNGVLTFQK